MTGRRARLSALVLLGGLAVPPARAAVAPVTIALESLTGAVPPQGEPHEVEVVVANGSDATATGTLTVILRGVDDQPLVAVDRWSISVAPRSSVSWPFEVVTSQWFAAVGAFRLTALGRFGLGASLGPGQVTPTARLDFSVGQPSIAPALFEDMTAAAGLAVSHPEGEECNNYAAGAAWGDFDRDGDLDLYLPMRDGPAKLWINDGAGRFADRATAFGVGNEDRLGIGASVADYDNDGDPDLYVVNEGPNRLYRNESGARFTDVTALAGVGEAGPGTSAAWGDYDADGRLDLYVTNHGRRSCVDATGFQPYRDALYHNEGGGTFSDRTELLTPAGEDDGLGFQAAWFDYDADGDADLYLANDRISPHDRPNILWRNDGPGPGGWRFTDVSDETDAGRSMNTMGIGIGDEDRDGRLDLALSNMGPNALLRNTLGPTFVERARAAGVDRPKQEASVMSITWGLGFSDLNLDGWEDLYVAAGRLEVDGLPEPQPNAVYLNLGDGRYADLSAPSGAADPGASRGVAFADYDRDGRVDLYVVPEDGDPRLYRNVTPRSGHWLEVRMVGVRSNRDGCGAMLRARVGGATLVRSVLCGSTSLASGSDPLVHFGLGGARKVRELEISWPSGSRQVLRNVRPDRVITIVER